MAVAPRRLTALLCAAACGLLHACASTRTPVPEPDRAASGGAADASYDWHGLVIAPFGTLLKDSPLPLHEVLLFHDEAHAGEADGRDCYAVERPPPHFVGRLPDEYLLCFSHDRLTRIDVSAELPAGESAAVFARACGLWRKEAPAAAPAPAAPAVAPRCEGRDGNVTFTAHLGSETGDAPNLLSISLVDAPDAPR